MFTKGNISRRQLHTPISYRAQRRLTFSSPQKDQHTSTAPTPTPSSITEDTTDAVNTLLNISTRANAITTVPNMQESDEEHNSE